jgi:hypothetical protein
MKRKTMLAGAAAIAIGGALGVATLNHAPAFAQPGAQPAGQPGAQPGMRGAGPTPEQRLARFQRMCTEGPARLAGMIAYAEVKLNLRAEQRPAWEQLTTAVRSAVQPLQRVCTETTALPEPTDLVGRMTMAERFMTAGAEAIRTVRPALVTFQATLSPEQQASLRELIARGGPGGHGRRGHHHMGMGMGGFGGPGMFGPPGGRPGPTPPAPGGNAPPPPARN